ncbi:MAG: hypothetical protein AMXMBFR36_14060 [Acidobacteriota bacterium]
MRRSLRRFATLAALLVLAAVPVAGQVVVDQFTTNQATITDPPGGASIAVTGGADILGQSRGLRVQRFAGAGPVSAGVAAGTLDVAVSATTPDSTGAAFLTWDGDNDPNALDPTGLGGVDLTAGGAGAFRFTIAAAAAGTSLVLEVYEDADSVSRGALVLPAIAVPVDIFVDFSSLAQAPGAATPADLTVVGAIALRIESGEATPALTLDRIETAAPQLAALKVDRTPAGDPIPGAVAPGDTIRYRITIANTGAGAAGVELADVLDANLALVAGSVRTTPLARPDVYRTVTDQPLDSSASALPTLLANDADPDGDALAAVPATGQATSQGGSVDVAADGHFVYTPPAGFNGVDDFLYTLAATAGDPTVDASGAPIGPATARARIVIDRAPPVLVAGGTLAYTENDPPTAIDPALTVTDADSANLVSATVQITGNYQNGEDVLSFTNTASITGVFTPATGTLALNGLDTVAAWQVALRSIAYENTSEDPDPADRTVTWTASDGVETSAPSTSTIEVTSVNDAPVVTTSGGATSFVEDGGAVVVDGALTVTDADDTDLVSATVTLTNPQNGAQESLSVAAPAATCPGLVLTGSGSPLSITGTASLAVYEGCLRSVRYDNASQNPTALPDRLVTIVADDGDDPSNTASKTVTVTPVNDPPVVTGESFQTISNTRLRVAATDPGPDANGPYVFAAGNLLANDSDPDGPAPLTTSLGTATAGAVVVVNSNGTFSYTSPAGRTIDDSFTYNVSDGDVSVQGTVTISFLQRVWYVRNDATTGGLGRSLDPFDTLAEAQTASAANDWIFVYNGDGTTAGQNAGITLKTGQRLVGEGVALSIPVALNGNPSPVSLVTAGTRPMLDNTTAGGSAAMATDVIPAQIVGLNLAGNTNAVDVTLTGAFAGSGTLEIANNTVRAAGVEGIDVNAGGTGTLTLAIHDNGITAGGTGLEVTRTNGTVQVTAFDDNVVSGNTGGSGLVLTGPLTLDATPGGAYQQVAGGVTVIGASGNGVGASGLVLNNVSGDLAFTDLDVFADAGTAIRAGGTGAVNVGAGTGTRVSVGAGVGIAEATGGPAVDLSNLTASLPLTTIRSTNTTTTGVSLATVLDAANPAFDAVFSAGPGSTISTAVGATGPAFAVSGGNGRIDYAGTITNNSAAARAVSIATWAGDDAADDLVLSGAIDENGAGILVNGCAGSRAITFSGGMDVDTGANDGFVATSNTNSLGLQITGTNTVDTTTGAALRVANTPIGSSGLTFRNLTAGTGAGSAGVGVSLDGTGIGASNGGLTVTGTGSAGSGGTIQHKTGADGSTSAGIGIFLRDTKAPSFSWMQLNDFDNSAITGRNVHGFTLQNSVINGTIGTSSAPVEGPINFGLSNPGGVNGLQGTGLIRNTRIRGGVEHNVEFYNQSGTMNLTIDGSSVINENNPADPNDDVADCVIEENSVAFGSDGIQIETQTDGVGGAPVSTIVIDRCLFRDNKSQAVQASALGGSSMTLTIDESVTRRFDQGNEGFLVSNGNSGDLTVQMSNNRCNNYGGVCFYAGQVAGNATTASELHATISGNTVGMPTTATNHGILVFLTSTVGQVSQARVRIDGNTVVNNSTSGTTRGILVDTPDTSTSPAYHVTVTNNSVSVGDNVAGVAGLVVQARQSSDACANIGSNSVTFPNGTPGGVFGLRARQVAPATYDLEQGPGCAGAPAAVLACRNPGATTEVLGTLTVVPAGTCLLPTVP